MTAAGPTPAAGPEGTLFRVIWRWHFYAGLFVAPVLMIMSLTGAIYIFSPEVHDAWYAEYVYASSTNRPHSLAQLLEIAEGASEGKAITGIEMSADPARSLTFSVDAPETEHGHYHLHVDPATGKVLGAVKEDVVWDFFGIVLLIHQQLFLGTTGRIITEVVTSWTIVLIATGIYLWWPRKWTSARGVWTPRWGAKFYTLLRDLHALTGVYLTPVLLVIAGTGLFYTVLWGESFHFITKDHSVPAKVEELPSGKRPPKPQHPDGPPPVFTVDQVVAVTQAAYPGRDLYIELPDDRRRNYSVTAINDWAHGTWGPMNSTSFHMHRDTGEVSKVEHMWQHQRYWWHTWTYPLHVGSFWGMTTKVLWLVAALALTFMPVTGLCMWWQRRPAGRSGFPRKPRRAMTLGLLSGIVALAILLPALAASIVVILLADSVIDDFSSMPQ